MTPAEAVNILILIGNRIDIQWGMFITVHLALFGGLLYIDRPLQRMEKLAVLSIYTGFAVVNFLVMKNQIVLMDYTYKDIVDFSRDACCLSNNLIQGIAGEAVLGKSTASVTTLIITHGLMYLLVTISILFDQVLSPTLKE